MFDVAERINELMAMKGWSAYELSNQVDITTNSVYDWFKGAEPSMQTIIKLCEIFEISLEYFFCGGNYNYNEEENDMLKEWIALSDLEKSAVMNLMETFRILKN